jgi:flagellar basal body rod protein FlgB
LTVDLDSANVKISKQLALYDTLTMQNIDLSEKVAIGSILKVNAAKILAMRERSSGKLVETSRASRTDAFRINFSIAKNEISEQGERQLYIQIVDSSGNTVASKGEITLFEDVQINYSDATTVNYMNEPIEVISLVEVDRDSIEKGIYIVNIYIENKIAGATQITLK